MASMVGVPGHLVQSLQACGKAERHGGEGGYPHQVAKKQRERKGLESPMLLEGIPPIISFSSTRPLLNSDLGW